MRPMRPGRLERSEIGFLAAGGGAGWRGLASGILLWGLGIAGSQDLLGQTVIPPGFKMPDGSVNTDLPGFSIKMNQMEVGRPSGNNLPDPILQARGQLIDPNTGEPYENLVDNTATLFPEEKGKWKGFVFSEGGVINYNQDARDNPDAGIGNFQPDKSLPGIPGFTDSTDNIAMEAVTYLELAAGTTRMGVNSDDGFVVSTATNPLDAFPLRLGLFNGGRGAADTFFEFQVVEDGVYCFILNWWEGGGGANVEWFHDNGGELILVNDRSNANAIKAFREATVSRSYLRSVSPEPGAFGVSLSPAIQFEIVDGDSPVAPSTVSLSLNGETVATPTVTKSGGVTTVQFKPSEPLPDSSEMTVELTYGDSATPPNLVDTSLSFLTERLPTDLPPLRQDEDGLVVMEAENFNADEAKEGQRWEFAKTPPDFSGSGAMYALPELGLNRASLTDALDFSPRVDIRVEFQQTGTHFIWYRGSDGGGDSLHVGLDGELTTTGERIDVGCCGNRAPGGDTWTWVNTLNASATDSQGVDSPLARFDVPSTGVHTVNFWMREDGTIVDKLIITPDPMFVPTGKGPPESRRVGDPFRPRISISSPSDGDTFPKGAIIMLTAEASDMDGSIARVEFFQRGEKFGEAASAPFTADFTPPFEGNFTLTARATDNAGDTKLSNPITVTSGNPPEVLFVGDNPPTSGADGVIVDHLQARGFNVTQVDDDDSVTEDANGKVLIVISSTSNSNDVVEKFTDVAVPIINWEQALQDNLLFTEDDGAFRGTLDNQTTVEILDGTHPLAGGLAPGTFEVVSSPQTFSWGIPDPAAVKPAIVGVLGSDSSRKVIYGFDKGETLIDGSPAAERRIMFFLANSTASALTPIGFHLFDSAINWALRLPVPPLPVTEEVKFEAPRLEGAAMVISWSGKAKLQEALHPQGPYADSPNQDNPQQAAITGEARFFRLIAP